MMSFVEGSKYFVFSEKGVHSVYPFFVESASCRQSNFVPYGPVSNPRWVLYHSLTFSGSLHLKKMPPIPVTRFIFTCALVVRANIALNAKPKPNEIESARKINVLLNTYF